MENSEKYTEDDKQNDINFVMQETGYIREQSEFIVKKIMKL